MRNPSESFAGRSESFANPRGGEEATASLPGHEQIAARAYELYVQSGYEQGQCMRNWLEAERELMQRFMSRLDGGRRGKEREVWAEDEAAEEAQNLGSSHLHLTYAEPETADIE